MVAKALPSRELVLQLLRYDADSGEFVWLPRPREMFPSYRGFRVWNTRFPGTPAGWLAATGYLYLTLDYAKFKAHRIAWLLHYGEPVPELIDHADGDKLNNRIANLRPATKAQNGANSGLSKRNSTGFKGVHRAHQNSGYGARIMIDGKLHLLGTFATAEEAAEARRDAATRLHGAFARDE
jgi:hypothetical protein